MGFEKFEKEHMQSLLLPDEDIFEQRERDLPANVLQFLREKDLLKRTRDYGIFPRDPKHQHKAENIIICKFFGNNFDILSFVKTLLIGLSPPYNLKIDFSMIIQNPTDGDMRYVWPQRFTALPFISRIYDETDAHELLSQINKTNDRDMTDLAFTAHANQSAFDKSGYAAHSILTTVFFLSKTTTYDSDEDISQ